MGRYKSARKGRPRTSNGRGANRAGIWVLLSCSLAIVATFAAIFSRGPSATPKVETGDTQEKPLLIERTKRAENPPRISETQSTGRFQICVAVRINCVVDGDTIWLDGVNIRIADIDAPEVNNPKCAFERQLGDQATFRLLELLNQGPFEAVSLRDRDVDAYGRELRVLMRGEKSIGEQLVEEGLARRWTGRREPWCS